ncbi:MAG: hypothetical protein QW356_05390 [Candidatus Hadarchaeales archaeon]
MPVYTRILTVPPNTPPESPKAEFLDVDYGILYRITIQIPPGHHGLTGMRILYGNAQLWPLPEGTWFRGSGVLLNFDERWVTPDRPTRLCLQGYNLDTAYEHSFYVTLGVLPPEEISFTAMAKGVAGRVTQALKTLFGIV